jgi:pyrroline-5-carboxylate reductase
MIRFIAAETVAIAVLVVSVLAGISERFASASLTPVFRALPITAAIVAAVLPILFFGGPQGRRPLK